MQAWYDFATGGTRFLLHVITRSRVVHQAPVPTTGPLLIVANHINFLDPPILAAAMPRTVSFMAKEELMHAPVLGWVVSNYEAFPVRRGEADRQALRTAIDLLGQGRAVGMFIEGTRSPDARMQQARAGAAVIAATAGCPILPVAITGTQALRGPLGFLTRPRIQVTSGVPFHLEDLGVPPGSGRSQRLADAMAARIAALLPPGYRGHYGTQDTAG